MYQMKMSHYHLEQATESPLRKDTCQKTKDEKKDRFHSLKKQRGRTKFEQKGHCQKLIANKG